MYDSTIWWRRGRHEKRCWVFRVFFLLNKIGVFFCCGAFSTETVLCTHTHPIQTNNICWLCCGEGICAMFVAENDHRLHAPHPSGHSAKHGHGTAEEVLVQKIPTYRRLQWSERFRFIVSLLFFATVCKLRIKIIKRAWRRSKPMFTCSSFWTVRSLFPIVLVGRRWKVNRTCVWVWMNRKKGSTFLHSGFLLEMGEYFTFDERVIRVVASGWVGWVGWC